MRWSSWQRLLLLVLSVMLMTVGLAPGSASAGACSGVTEPLQVQIDMPANNEGKAGAQITYRVQVTNCSTQEWTGNVRVDISGGAEGNWCVPERHLAGKPVTVKAGSSQSVNFQADLPRCLTGYTATATAYDTIDRAEGVNWFSVYRRGHRGAA